MKSIIRKIIVLFLATALVLCLYGCNAISNIKETISALKHDDIEDVCQKLKEQTVGEYQYTSVFKEFGDRTILQLDVQDKINRLVIPYCLIFPKDYKPGTKYPVLTYLHGAGEKGNDNNSHLNLMVRYCKNYPQFLNDAFIVCPQCPDGGWWNALGKTQGLGVKNLDLVMKVLEDLPNYCSVDTNRYYVTGVSMGGYGTFNIISAYPNKFAAAVPICGGGDTKYAKKLVDVPIWLFHSRDDDIVNFEGSNSMYNAIKAAGGEKINFTILDGMGHNAWNATEHNDELFRWIFNQNKGDTPSLDYTHMLEIRDSDNNPIFNETDFVLSYYGDSGITLILNQEKHSFYKELTSKKQTLTVFYEGKSIGEIKIENVVEDGIIVFETTLSKDDAVALCSKI